MYGAVRDTIQRRGIMAYEITNECICCGACMSECPVEIISEGAEMYKIDAALCTSCGGCVAVCLVGAIREIV
jgi:ferredoxin